MPSSLSEFSEHAEKGKLDLRRLSAGMWRSSSWGCTYKAAHSNPSQGAGHHCYALYSGHTHLSTGSSGPEVGFSAIASTWSLPGFSLPRGLVVALSQLTELAMDAEQWANVFSCFPAYFLSCFSFFHKGLVFPKKQAINLNPFKISIFTFQRDVKTMQMQVKIIQITNQCHAQCLESICARSPLNDPRGRQHP